MLTAREFSDTFKGEFVVRTLVKEAGINENTWYQAVRQHKELSPDQFQALQRAVLKITGEASEKLLSLQEKLYSG